MGTNALHFVYAPNISPIVIERSTSSTSAIVEHCEFAETAASHRESLSVTVFATLEFVPASPNGARVIARAV